MVRFLTRILTLRLHSLTFYGGLLETILYCLDHSITLHIDIHSMHRFAQSPTLLARYIPESPRINTYSLFLPS
jgi:hypothetical protein